MGPTATAAPGAARGWHQMLWAGSQSTHDQARVPRMCSPTTHKTSPASDGARTRAAHTLPRTLNSGLTDTSSTLCSSTCRRQVKPNDGHGAKQPRSRITLLHTSVTRQSFRLRWDSGQMRAALHFFERPQGGSERGSSWEACWGPCRRDEDDPCSHPSTSARLPQHRCRAQWPRYLPSRQP